MEQAKMEDKVVGALVGLACGDAVGTTLEFKPFGSFTPITDMIGGGPFRLQKGEWTDDTSMALCLGMSLLECEGFNPDDQMARYLRWKNEGYLSSTGTCFDIGMTVSNALLNYEDSLDPFSGPTEARYSGNGSIMRLAPVPIFFAHNFEQGILYAAESSRTTHGAELCIDACKLLAQFIMRAFAAQDKAEVFAGLKQGEYAAEFASFEDGSFMDLGYHEISGSGYVVDSLIAAMWCFYHSENFRDAILMAANLGDDADTTAAICGQVAGAYYGYSNIPEDWRDQISMDFEIKHLAKQLYRKGLALL